MIYNWYNWGTWDYNIEIIGNVCDGGIFAFVILVVTLA
jgi:hypothetical protein